jgi:DNA repair exonuclease SbcCD ATPase subunit
MTSGFNANVPARKPRTQIGRVITELTSESEEVAGASVPESAGLDGVEAARLESIDDADGGPAPRTAAPPTASRNGPAPTTAPVAQEASRVAAGRERLDALRQRLAVAARPSAASTEPRRTAAAVLEVVDQLRARLDAVIRERSALADTLEEARSELARAEAELEKERKMRLASEARDEERARIADEAVAEAEALAAERDQVLAELNEQRRLDDEQTELLEEAEAALGVRDAERASAAAEMAELRKLLEARAVEIDDLESRLRAGAADHARTQSRCRELEAEVAKLGEAREALETIEATVTRPVPAPPAR